MWSTNEGESLSFEMVFLAVNLTITWPIVVSDEVKIDP